ncbi:CAP domain-containing protein [Actinoplanes sp. OR16]|uniref:CAP domain-containing protein n=1 Tax=Actinoplanes sp. OR16 TaxID=946334 RepID=UPI000FD97A66|nr:CAP domain-containing protein [Actinoplanes sp. OR16]
MFDLVVRRVVMVAATPALLVLAAPALGHGPDLPSRPGHGSPPAAQPRVVPSAPAAKPAATTLARLRARTMMLQVVRLTNERRKAAGCPALAVDQDLSTASMRQSWYMARTRLFSHVWRDGATFVSRSRAAGYRQPAGENIGWGYPTAAAVVQAWMESPGHRANILNCGAKSIGTGVAYAADGTPYYTQVFGWK